MDIADKAISCPHCGHHIHLLLDASNGDQDYYEDCPACCNAIHVNFHLNEGNEKLDIYISNE